ncbi:MAG: YihY/virulence factor BrkB family protein [Actinomycetota bacterium]|nr:YihY/virulence factor BrkB family protein [Actinomycetota bacterium]
MSSPTATSAPGRSASISAPTTSVPNPAVPSSSSTARSPRSDVAAPDRRRFAPLSVLGRTLSKAWKDRILGLSAEAAFWQLLSLPPLLLALLGSLGYFSDVLGANAVTVTEDRLTDWLSSIVTTDVIDSIVVPTVNEVLSRGRLDLISLGFGISLWVGSSAMATFVNTIVIAYDQRDVRGPIRSRLLALWLFIAFGLTAVLTLPLLLLGPGLLLSWFPQNYQETVGFLITLVYPVVVCLLIVVMLASLYHVVLPRRLPWRRHVPGAVFAMVVFVLGAWGLRIYVSYFFATTVPYAALAAPIAALLFFFLLGLSILLGAELNAAIQARWPAPPRKIDRRRSARRAMEAERTGVTMLSL